MGTEVNAAISAALPLIESLFALGLPGIILMLAAIPALVIAVVFILDHRHGKRTEMLLEAYRQDTQNVLRAVSEKHEAILRDMSEKHEETAEFYRK
ncbi:MAG TPA: transcriptional regulator, partial [Candidatus Desulfovibrio intestinigallinarum]|nr:transcriptional regulator [Candidatus Desulfovibrio intestinigallinarum]